ncbi:MAG TPA: hypothetical protein VKA92_08810 [Segetibacter sp.]|jgi:hypothetical protein|nr:hypothetical protein [Segetibacter sp.]
MQDQSFQLLLNGVPYVVKASPYEFNTETRFSVSFNGSEDFIFTYNAAVGRYVAIGDETSTIPDDLEVAIADKLYSLV